MSYSAYLLHFLVLYQLDLKTPIGRMSPLPRFAALAVAGVGLTVPVAYLFFRYLETPSQRLARRWIATLESDARSRRGVDLPERLTAQ